MVGTLLNCLERIRYDVADSGGGGGGRGFPGLPSLPGAGGPYESLETDQDTLCLTVQRSDTFLLVQQQGLSLG